MLDPCQPSVKYLLATCLFLTVYASCFLQTSLIVSVSLSPVYPLLKFVATVKYITMLKVVLSFFYFPPATVSTRNSRLPPLKPGIHNSIPTARKSERAWRGWREAATSGLSRGEADGAPFSTSVRHTILAGNSAIFFSKVGSRKVEEGAQKRTWYKIGAGGDWR